MHPEDRDDARAVVDQVLERMAVQHGVEGAKRLLEDAREPAHGRDGAVVVFAEGRDHPAECFGEDNRCSIAPVCRLAGVFEEALGAFYTVLDRHTLEDLVHNRARIVSILRMHPRAA